MPSIERYFITPVGREARMEAWRWGYLLIKTKAYPGWGPAIGVPALWYLPKVSAFTVFE